MFPEFTTHAPQTDGEDADKNPLFLFFKGMRPRDEFARLRLRLLIGTMAAVLTGVVALYVLGRNATPEFTLLVASLIALCGLVLYDIISRRLWENTVTGQVQTLVRNHDRLVREVARNRSDVSILREGLVDAAEAVSEQGRHLAPNNSAEARMLETIVGKLGALGKMTTPESAPLPSTAPKAITGTVKPPISPVPELQATPPSRKTPQKSELDKALAMDFDNFSDTMVINLLQNAVEEDRVDIFMQPVVSLPQRKARMYEVFARIRATSGAYLPAARYMAFARKESMVQAIDNLLLLRCLQILRDRSEQQSETPFVLNIAAETLHDTGFMGDLVSFISEYKNMAARLVFEIPQSELEKIDVRLVPVLDGLSRLGCRFSMDRITGRKFDIGLLKSRHIRFIKLDAAWLAREAKAEGGMGRIQHLKSQLDTAGIDLIVEKIETENDLRALLDFNLDYGQGWLFGKPDLYGTWKGRQKAA